MYQTSKLVVFTFSTDSFNRENCLFGALIQMQTSISMRIEHDQNNSIFADNDGNMTLA
jgi:hypothetical protein